MNRPTKQGWGLSILVGLVIGLVEGLWLLFNWLANWSQWEKGCLTIAAFVLVILVLNAVGLGRFRFAFLTGAMFGLTAHLIVISFWSVFSSHNPWFMSKLTTDLSGSNLSPRMVYVISVLPVSILFGLAFGGIAVLARQMSVVIKPSVRA